MINMNKFTVVCVFTCFIITNVLFGQFQPPEAYFPEQKPVVSILGVFHFKDAGLDDYKPQFPFDIFEEKRQKELEVLLDQLAQFKPTKILIEVPRHMDSLINARYSAYIKNEYSIDESPQEIYQIGFKLAKKLGHDRLYASDHHVTWCGEELDWDNFSFDKYREERGQQERYIRNTSMYFPLAYLEDSLKTVQTLSHHLSILSHPESARLSHSYYLTGTALTGAGDNYLGGDSVSRWYRRNIHIYSNIYDIADDDEDRVLVIYGSGHLHILRQLIKDSPIFEYEEINGYLKE